jgi:hypothetical protein
LAGIGAGNPGWVGGWAKDQLGKTAAYEQHLAMEKAREEEEKGAFGNIVGKVTGALFGAVPGAAAAKLAGGKTYSAADSLSAGWDGAMTGLDLLSGDNPLKDALNPKTFARLPWGMDRGKLSPSFTKPGSEYWPQND